MDPITGIGLAASVVQLVQFSINAAQTCQKIYQQGSTSEHQDADYTADKLATLVNSLQQSLNNTGSQPAVLPKEEKDLIELSHKCQECATKLQHELRKFQNFDAQTLKTNKNFTELNESLKSFITGLANSQTSLDTLVSSQMSLGALVKHEAEQIRQCISAQSAHLERLDIEECFYQKFIRSLFYAEIFSRQEHVAYEFDGIENSYEWVFEEPSAVDSNPNHQFINPRNQPPWANFSEWLRSGSRVYWISGKAGSGKSTLMNYIRNHKQKKELLEQWSAERRLLTPTFFFWNAGVRQQKTIEGLLRSLIYQILTECRELIACFKNELLHAWNEERLLNAFSALLTQTQVPVAICLFIDGLDEFDGSYNAVVDTIHSLFNYAHVKICLSSRPLSNFEKAFHGMSSLRLQDLTFNSILAYADYQLSDLIERRTFCSKIEKENAQDLLELIVRRAEGVFLWAVIAIRDIRHGLQDMADFRELEILVEALPAGIENLYMQMLNRVKSAYRRETVRFLQTVLYHSEISAEVHRLELDELYFIDLQRVSEDLSLVFGSVEKETLVKACHNLKTRLLSHTMGLLDLVPAVENSELYMGRDCDPILRTEIKFHHRTVKEFLLHNTDAKSFIAAVGSKEENVRLAIARGKFAYLAHLSLDPMIRCLMLLPYLETLRSALEQVVIVEQLVSVAQSKLIRSLLNFFSVPHGRIDINHPARSFFSPPYLINGPLESSVDLIGMAVEFGMVRFICEVTDSPVVESQPCSINLSDFQQFYSTKEVATAHLSWTTPTKRDLYPSDYCRWLRESLKWKAEIQDADVTVAKVDDKTLTATYLLACCSVAIYHSKLKESLSLIRVLLSAGADPMVRVDPNEVLSCSFVDECFWSVWLNFLRDLGRYPIGLRDKRVSHEDIFNTTKALLAQGANINFKIDQRFYTSCLLDGRRFVTDALLKINCSAMFWLEKWFQRYSEFRNFAAATKAPVKRPWRKIDSIVYMSRDIADHKDRPRAFPTDEETEMLWLIIEKWEESEQDNDKNKLESAIARVFTAHFPDIELEGRYE